MTISHWLEVLTLALPIRNLRQNDDPRTEGLDSQLIILSAWAGIEKGTPTSVAPSS